MSISLEGADDVLAGQSRGRKRLLKVFQRSVAATASARAQSGVEKLADGDAPVQAAGDVLPIPANIVSWLAELTLLYGLPFEYLVPDAAMLPPESIRFFYLDRNWTNRLVDGAVNIALGSSQDYVHILTIFEDLAHQVAIGQSNVRALLRKKPLADAVLVDSTLTGVLLRSAVVSGWPGLEVQGFADAEGLQALPLLRLDRLSDNVLLCIFNGVPQLVNFSEPAEGLHFGVLGTGSEGTGYQVALRGVGGKYPAGEQINDADGQAYTSPVSFRSDQRSGGVLNIAQTKDDLIGNLSKLGALPLEEGSPLFTAAQFAVQMVKGAGLQQFKIGAGAGLMAGAEDDSTASQSSSSVTA